MRGKLACFLLFVLAVPAAFADDADFAGQWMIRIVAPDVVPYEGLLELEQRGESELTHSQTDEVALVLHALHVGYAQASVRLRQGASLSLNSSSHKVLVFSMG